MTLLDALDLIAKPRKNETPELLLEALRVKWRSEEYWRHPVPLTPVEPPPGFETTQRALHRLRGEP